MTTATDSLRTLHRIHRQQTDLQGQLDRGPKTVRAAQIRAQKLEEERDRVKHEATKVRMAADEKNLQLKVKEGRIDDLQAKLNGCSTNKEYQALQEQIAADKMTSSVLQDEILESLEKVDEFQIVVGEAEKVLVAGQQQVAGITEKVQAKQASLESDLARVEQELQAAEAELPEDLKGDYDRVVRSKGEDAMAQLDGDCCGGCYHSLTPNSINSLMLSKIVFCQICGRLLYLPEDRTPGHSD
jgi:predicted  nucleic acid-binding Zn-ribbon protein